MIARCPLQRGYTVWRQHVQNIVGRYLRICASKGEGADAAAPKKDEEEGARQKKNDKSTYWNTPVWHAL